VPCTTFHQGEASALWARSGDAALNTPLQPDFWLGARSELRVTDFDGHLRRCFRLGEARYRANPAFRYIWLRVDPPVRVGREFLEVALTEHWADSDLDQLADEWLPVHTFGVLNRTAFEKGSVDQGDMTFLGQGEIARSPSLLPKTQEEEFEEHFAMLQRFVNREGHAHVPEGHEEEGIPIGNWVGNTKYEQARGSLRPEWESRLEALPGWRWLSGDDFFLLGRFAIEHGHARVPLGYVDEGRPIGQWVKELRKTHAVGMLSRDWVRRLENIPGWEW